MEQRITGGIVQEPDFQIRSKKDAKKFLSMVIEGSHMTIRDVNDPTMYFVVFRPKGAAEAHIAHETSKKEWYDPDLMRSGEEAVALVYQGRKTFNREFFNKEE